MKKKFVAKRLRRFIALKGWNQKRVELTVTHIVRHFLLQKVCTVTVILNYSFHFNKLINYIKRILFDKILWHLRQFRFLNVTVSCRRKGGKILTANFYYSFFLLKPSFPTNFHFSFTVLLWCGLLPSLIFIPFGLFHLSYFLARSSPSSSATPRQA